MQAAESFNHFIKVSNPYCAYYQLPKQQDIITVCKRLYHYQFVFGAVKLRFIILWWKYMIIYKMKDEQTKNAPQVKTYIDRYH